MNSQYEERFMLRAIELATKNVENCKGGPFGSVVVKDGQILAEAVNTVTSDNDPTSHAEINAIRQACKKTGSFSLEGCQIYASCEPCPMCLGAIFWARPEVVYFAENQHQAADYGFDDSFIYEQIQLQNEQRKIPFIKKDIPNSSQPFEAWKNNEKSIKY